MSIKSNRPVLLSWEDTLAARDESIKWANAIITCLAGIFDPDDGEFSRYIEWSTIASLVTPDPTTPVPSPVVQRFLVFHLRQYDMTFTSNNIGITVELPKPVASPMVTVKNSGRRSSPSTPAAAAAAPGKASPLRKRKQIDPLVEEKDGDDEEEEEDKGPVKSSGRRSLSLASAAVSRKATPLAKTKQHDRSVEEKDGDGDEEEEEEDYKPEKKKTPAWGKALLAQVVDEDKLEEEVEIEEKFDKTSTKVGKAGQCTWSNRAKVPFVCPNPAVYFDVPKPFCEDHCCKYCPAGKGPTRCERSKDKCASCRRKKRGRESPDLGDQADAKKKRLD
jgi:hypothetical protein